MPESSRAPRPADLGPPTTLVLVRHGRTELTEQRRFSGGGGRLDPPLSPAGRQDADDVAEALGALGDPGGVLADVGPLAAVVSSPMRRTRQTAERVAAAAGLEVSLDEGWVEAGFGEWDGLTLAEIAGGWPDLLRAWQGSPTVAPPGGESLEHVAGRVRSVLTRTVAGHPGAVVAVVTHVTPIRAAVREALDAGVATLWRVRLAPCSVTAIRYWCDGGVEVMAVNGTGHLRRSPVAPPIPI